MGKVREFWKDNKKAIIFGVSSGIVFGVMQVKLTGEEKKLIGKLRAATPSKPRHRGANATHDLLNAMKGASYMEVHEFGDGIKVRDLGSELVEHYTKKGYPLDAEVKGLVLFENGR